MKKKAATDAKRAAANDKPENGQTEKPAKKSAKRTEPDAKFTLGSIATVKRGFLLAFVEFVKKKGTVDAAILIEEFAGRQIDGKKITAARVHRYIGYCKTHGIFVQANGR